MTQRLDLYVWGAGGHGKVVAEAALAAGRFSVRGYLDDDVTKRGRKVLGLPILGGLDALADLEGRVAVAAGIGDNRTRLNVLAHLEGRNVELCTVTHPSAVVASTALLGPWTYVGPGAVVHADARLGRACIVNSGAVVEHDNQLGEGVHVAGNATLGGNVVIGDGTLVGLGAVVLPGVTIGAWVVVGAGAAVLRDLSPHVVAVGCPARVLERRT